MNELINLNTDFKSKKKLWKIKFEEIAAWIRLSNQEQLRELLNVSKLRDYRIVETTEQLKKL